MANTTIDKSSGSEAETPDQVAEINNKLVADKAESIAKPEDNSLSMVRDILFGEQKREHDQRIIDLEIMIDNHDQKVRRDMSNDFDILNTEIRLLNQLLSDENKARLDDNAHFQDRLKKLSQQHIALSENMQKMFTQLSAEMKADNEALKKTFSKDIHELMAFFEEEHSQLKKNKADRELLANTFAELAKQLNSKL